MRKSFAIVTTMSLLVMFGCTVEQDDQSQVSDDQKDKIIAEIETKWLISSAGVEELDTERAFSIFSQKENTKYIRAGYLYPSITVAKKQYSEWFSNPEAQRQNMEMDTVIYDILKDDLVMMTAIASITKVDSINSQQEPWVIGYTLLWQKEDLDWWVINMHNSWE